MKKGSVLIAAPVHSLLTDGLREQGYEIIQAEKASRAEALGLLANCEGVIISTRLQMDREAIDSAPGLRWIGRMGSGMEVIDVEYALQKGVVCYSSPEGNCNAVAEHCLGLLLSLTKKIVVSQSEVREGLWRREINRGVELEGKTVGIIGFGHTGRAFAKKLSGFDMKVLAYDKYAQEGFPSEVVCCRDLTPIYENADVISFHVPLQQDTAHYFNRSFLDHMKKQFWLLNCSRGAVADTAAILEGLSDGKIKGAGLDVLEGEPLETMAQEKLKLVKKILEFPQAIVTPHIAGYSLEATYKMSKVLLDKIVTGR